MTKNYISANDLLLDSFRLAQQVYEEGFRPSFIIGIWRGGAPVGIAVQEYLEFRGVSADHIAIRTSSYYGIDQQAKQVKVYGLNYVVDNARSDQQLLIVDDVFDSGRSVNAVIEEIQHKAKQDAPTTIRVACPWFKPSRNLTSRTPDFYVHVTEDWLVFPHEICGLGRDEILDGKGRELAEIIYPTPPLR